MVLRGLRDAAGALGRAVAGDEYAHDVRAGWAPPSKPARRTFLVYPGVDMTRKHPSRRQFGEGFLLTEENMTFYEDCYVPDRARRADPRVSPLLAPDLSGLPPAYVATALADPLRDEGDAYAHRLRAAGVPVALHRHPQIHGFFSITAMRSGMTGLTVAAGALRQALA